MATKANFTVCADLIDRAIPDPDPRECDWASMKYRVDVPQRQLDIIKSSTASDVTMLADGLILFGARMGDASLDARESQSAGHFIAAIAEIIGSLTCVAERAAMMIEQPDDAAAVHVHKITLDAIADKLLEQSAAAAGMDADDLATEILCGSLRRAAKGDVR